MNSEEERHEGQPGQARRRRHERQRPRDQTVVAEAARQIGQIGQIGEGGAQDPAVLDPRLRGSRLPDGEGAGGREHADVLERVGIA